MLNSPAVPQLSNAGLISPPALHCSLYYLLPCPSGQRLFCLWPGAVQCSAVQCSAVQCSAVQCSAVQCSCRFWVNIDNLAALTCLQLAHLATARGHCTWPGLHAWPAWPACMACMACMHGLHGLHGLHGVQACMACMACMARSHCLHDAQCGGRVACPVSGHLGPR
jgi:hypothetical protein